MTEEFSDPNDAIVTTDPEKKKFYDEINQHHDYDEEDDWGIGDQPLTIDTRGWKQIQDKEDQAIRQRQAEDDANFYQEVPLDYVEGQEYNRRFYGQTNYDTIKEEPVTQETKYTDYYPQLRQQLKAERTFNYKYETAFCF